MIAARRSIGARAALAVAIAGCVGPRGDATLPAAGRADDDGAGQLAQASVQIRLGDGATDLDVERERERERSGGPRRYRRGGFEDSDAAYAGTVYGLETSVGGSRYGLGGMGRVGFGIVGPMLPPRTDGGDSALIGLVTWRGDRGVVWPAGCTEARVAHAGGAAAGAVVYLVNAPLRRERGDDDRWTTARGAIEADRCALWPAAQAIGPVPAIVDVETGGDGALTLAVTGRKPVPLDPGGRAKVGIDADGLIRVDADGRAPAWIISQPHDYHTVTDAHGRFVLDGVPAGAYELVVWFPPMVRALDGGQPVWTEPTVVRRRVTVGEGESVRLGFALDPAP